MIEPESFTKCADTTSAEKIYIIHLGFPLTVRATAKDWSRVDQRPETKGIHYPDLKKQLRGGSVTD
jgi:hypothetical protein